MKLSSARRFAKQFVLSYLAALPRIVYRSSLSVFLDPRGSQRFVHRVLDVVDLEEDDRHLGSEDVEQLIDTAGADILLVGRFYSRQSSDTRLLMELASLAALVRSIQPQLIFEFGTFVGRTTRLLAANSPKDCRVVTLDLPQDRVPHQIGQDFRDSPEAHRISQIYGDSKAFDYSPWIGKCDFVWVDACHDYDYVVSDTRSALALCRPGGWIAWHDYRHSAFSWSGVTRAVRELKSEYSTLRHIRGTTIAVLNKPKAG